MGNNLHGKTKHTAASVLVQACINRNGPDFSLFRKDDERNADICWVEISDNNNGGMFGIRIYEKRYFGFKIFGKEVKLFEVRPQEITVFFKEKMKTSAQVVKYLNNQGYW